VPQIGYACECGHSEKIIVSGPKLGLLSPREKCPKCGKETLKRQLGRTNSVSKITVDNGLMGKAVELIPAVIDDKYKKR
jgi:hypothetical protein